MVVLRRDRPGKSAALWRANLLPEFRGRGAKTLRAEWDLRNVGKIPVKIKVRDQLFAMRDAVHAHPVAAPMFQGPGLSDELFESQHQSLLRELENLERQFARP